MRDHPGASVNVRMYVRMWYAGRSTYLRPTHSVRVDVQVDLQKLRWAATFSKGFEVAHLLQESEVPWCSRRQAVSKQRKLVRIAATGATAESLRRMSWTKEVFCSRCLELCTPAVRELALSCAVLKF